MIDLGGRDTYGGDGVAAASNGGATWDPAYVGETPTQGFLLDAGVGNDTYLGSASGSNGGGVGALSMRVELLIGWYESPIPTPHPTGFLFDESGDDLYSSVGNAGVNCGAADAASGTLVDAAGNDRYVAAAGGTANGGASTGLGLLLDYAGRDRYEQGDDGRTDCTVFPKGTVGAQIDYPRMTCDG